MCWFYCINKLLFPRITQFFLLLQCHLLTIKWHWHVRYIMHISLIYRFITIVIEYIVCTLHILLLYNVNPLLHKPNQSKLSYILWDDEDILMQNKRKLERLYWYEIYYMNKIQVVYLMEIFIFFKLGLMLKCVVALLDHMEHFMQIKFKKLIFMAACTCICHFITNKMGVSVP